MNAPWRAPANLALFNSPERQLQSGPPGDSTIEVPPFNGVTEGG